MNKIIVGMGEALWDCLPEGKKIGGAPVGAMGEEVWEAVDELIKNRESTIDLILVVTSGRVNA